MVYSTENFYKTFEQVRKRISNKLCITEINSNHITLRSDIKNLVETLQFIKAYEAVTRSRFRCCFSKTACYRSVPGKTWMCSHKDSLKMHKKCPARIIMSIKKINKYNRLKDAYLRRNPPFRAVIKIEPNHNHLLMMTSCKQLKISSPVKECFYEYFKRGISGVKAKIFHEKNLHKANFHALGDASMNPSLPAICSLYKNWKNLKENVQLNKVLASKVSKSVQVANVHTNNTIQITSDHGFIDNNKTCKYEIDTGENVEFHKINNEDLPSFSQVEDIKPVLNIKKEIDDIDGLPVIQSYGSLAATPVNNSKSVMRVGSTNTKLVLYTKSSNTFQVVKYVSVGPTFNVSDQASSQYNSYLPRTLLPPRIALHRI